MARITTVGMLFLFLLAPYSAEAACRNVPERNPGQTWQYIDSMPVPGERLAPAPNPVPPVGRDIVYEGRNCPEGRICIETMYNVFGSRDTIHGQVIVLDKVTGDVVEMLPLQIRGTPGDCGLPSSNSRCIPVYNQERVTHLCQSLRIPASRRLGNDPDERAIGEAQANFCEGQNVNPWNARFDAEIAYHKRTGPNDRALISLLNMRKEAMNRRRPANVLDAYYVNFDTDAFHREPNQSASPFFWQYLSLTPDLRSNMIRFFNEGTTNTDGNYRQGSTALSKPRCTSEVAENCAPRGQAGGTMTTLARIIAKARRALRCEVVVGSRPPISDRAPVLKGSVPSRQQQLRQRSERAH